MLKKKSLKIVCSIIFIGSLLVGCTADQTNLKKTKSDGLTFSEYFRAYDRLDERRNSKFYKPLSMNEVQSTSLPDEMKKVIHPIDLKDLPFKVDEENVYFVTSKSKEGKGISQAQVSYLGKNEYGNTERFYIISVTESDRNPLNAYDTSDEVDLVGNKLKKEHLTDNLPIYQQVLTTNSALLYRYYQYNDEENKITIVGTSSNEFYAYYNGYIYHVGYLIDREKNDEEMQEKMLQLTREYILGSSRK
ncbi:hypothetical protein SLU01_08930 [Sporosarcina luteola]|uniref:Lipoprotein n=1 Tax=Sporosarcina luteola TaxID=582850 RepID=A0A511Z556_9BACL|nr:hypothetical protein [Sporosarcina luteola]GEN82581.1 hypothetical protein SLU01_08930 [Sporosarcina luteola]